MYVYLEVLGDFTDKSLKGKLPDEKLSRLLVPPNFTKSDSSGAESMRLLHASSGSLRSVKMSLTKPVWVFTGNRRTAAVFLAALVASCLRGALPAE